MQRALQSRPVIHQRPDATAIPTLSAGLATTTEATTATLCTTTAAVKCTKATATTITDTEAEVMRVDTSRHCQILSRENFKIYNAIKFQ